MRIFLLLLLSSPLYGESFELVALPKSSIKGITLYEVLWDNPSANAIHINIVGSDFEDIQCEFLIDPYGEPQDIVSDISDNVVWRKNQEYTNSLKMYSNQFQLSILEPIRFNKLCIILRGKAKPILYLSCFRVNTE